MGKYIERFRQHLHKRLGYGYPTNRNGGDSFQPTYGCKYCDRKLAQDSQGNWFHLS